MLCYLDDSPARFRHGWHLGCCKRGVWKFLRPATRCIMRLTVLAGWTHWEQTNQGGNTSHFRREKTMSGKKGLIVVVLALVMATMAVVPAAAGRGGRCGAMGGSVGGGMRGGPGMGRGAMPAFTEEQQEKMQEIRSSFDEERVELVNRIKVMHLEMRDIVTGDNPDFGKLERMIDDISSQRAEMMKMRIRQHVAVRKILTDDQKVLFDQGFGMQMGQGMCGHPGAMGGKPGGGMMGGRGGMNCGPGGGMMGRPGGGMPPSGAPGGMGI